MEQNADEWVKRSEPGQFWRAAAGTILNWSGNSCSEAASLAQGATELSALSVKPTYKTNIFVLTAFLK